MTLAEMVADVRAATDQDASGQVPPDAYRRWIDQEYQAVRRLLGSLIPSLYLARVSFTIATGNTWAITPPLWGRLHLLERDNGPGNYVALAAANPLDPERIPWRYVQAVLERGNVLEIYPELTAAGNYRATYIAQPARLAVDGSADGTVVDVPPEFDRVIAERVAARVRVRVEEDPAPHIRAAEEALREGKWYLRRRYGVMAEAGILEGR
jgi:hypothetical protein